MLKFIIISSIFHLTILIFLKLDFIELDKKKDKVVNVGIIEEKLTTKKEVKKKKPPKKQIKEAKKKKPPKKQIKEAKKKKPPKKQTKEVKKKESTRNVKKTEDNKKNFDDMLKNLAKEDLNVKKNDNDINKTIQDLSQKKFLAQDLDSKKEELSNIEKLIISQIDQNWSRPPGIKIAKDLNIKLIIYLNINGEVINLEVHSKTKKDINSNKSLQPYLDSAIRAIKKSSPFEGLRKDRYSIWKEIIINFKPIETR